MAKQNVLLVNLHPLSSRNFFTSNVVEKLSKDPDRHFYILVPDYKRAFFEANYSYPNFTYISISKEDNQAVSLSWKHRLFTRLATHLQRTKAIENRLVYYVQRDGGKRNFAELVLYRSVFSFIAILPGFKRFISFLDRSFSRYPEIEDVLRKYKIQIVISTDAFNILDQVIALVSTKLSIPTIGMIRSWDNPLSKGELRPVYDRLLVNNDFIKQNMESYHRTPMSKMVTVGTPQFDAPYLRNDWDRHYLRKQFNIPPDHKIILFGSSGFLLDQIDLEVCELLESLQDKGHISSKISFVVRPHPTTSLLFKQYKFGENFYLSNFGTEFKEKPYGTEFAKADQDHLFNSLASADLMVFTHTTLAIDALTFDLPQIAVCYSPSGSKEFWKDPLVYHDEEHFKRFLDTGATFKAFNENELIEGIKRYLSDRSIDSEKRKVAAEREIFSTDGSGGDRVAKEIVNFLNESSVY